MQFLGFPTVEQMHMASELCEEETSRSSLNFYTYVLEVIKAFKGRNATPRVICNSMTREYLLFECRSGHEEDKYEMPDVYNRFVDAGFYCEHADSELHRKSNTSSLLICWDPKVIRNAVVRKILDDNDTYNLYLTISRYISAENLLPRAVRTSKDYLMIHGLCTQEWISLPLVTTSMFEDAIKVGDVLWKMGYYVGIRQDTRREETWTLFVCWDTAVTQYRGEPTACFEFTGEVPSSWK